MTRAVFLAALALGFLAASPRVRSDSAEPQARLLDLAGKEVDAFSGEARKAIVFIFLSVDCPISNSYAPELRRLRDEFASNGIAFKLIYPIADQLAEEVRKHLKEFDLEFEALRDPAHSLVKAAKARVTPEAAVYLPEKGWVYRGRIDDRHVDFGKKRPAATQHDLRDLLRAVAAGKAVSPTVTRAVGCYIPGIPLEKTQD